MPVMKQFKHCFSVRPMTEPSPAIELICNTLRRSMNHVTCKSSLLSALLLLPLLLPFRGLSQEMLGIINSNDAGVASVLINPAATVTSRYYLDINLLTLGVFAENNYIYLKDSEYRFSRFLEKNPEYPVHGENDQSTYDYYNTRDKQAYANLRVMGPSAMLVLDRHAFGFTTGFRTVGSFNRLPYDVAKFLYDDFDFKPQQDINYVHPGYFDGHILSWAEIGGNYSYIFKRDGFNQWSAGVNLRYLAGYAGAYSAIDYFDYIVYDEDTLQVNRADGKAGISLPLDYETNDVVRRPLFRGRGAGMDFGVVFERKTKGYQNWDRLSLCTQQYNPYVYRIGLSILDVGRIRFNKNTYYMEMEKASTFWAGISSLDYTTVNNYVGEISYHFLGDSSALIKGNQITIGLPTALSLQADYNFRPNWYVNGTVVVPVKVFKNSVSRESLIAITPRFENEKFGISLPVSLFNYYKPRVGIAFRYKGFFIGSEKPSGFFHFSDFTGLDFYTGIKISFAKGDCRRKAQSECGDQQYLKYKNKDKGKPKMGLGITQ